MIDFISTNSTLVGLLFFVVFFTAIVLWTFRPGAKATYNKYAHIPLEESES